MLLRREGATAMRVLGARKRVDQEDRSQFLYDGDVTFELGIVSCAGHIVPDRFVKRDPDPCYLYSVSDLA